MTIPTTDKETIDILKDLLGLPDELIGCNIILSTNSLITITDCSFYATKKSKSVEVSVSGKGCDIKTIRDMLIKALNNESQ